MKNKGILKALSKIERYEDDLYDIILRVKVNNEYIILGYVLRAVRFDLLKVVFKKILKKNSKYAIELGQGADYKSNLYITFFFDERNMSFEKIR